jgi:hypothetical protein
LAEIIGKVPLNHPARNPADSCDAVGNFSSRNAPIRTETRPIGITLFGYVPNFRESPCLTEQNRRSVIDNHSKRIV